MGSRCGAFSESPTMRPELVKHFTDRALDGHVTAVTTSARPLPASVIWGREASTAMAFSGKKPGYFFSLRRP
jgi:hypothetical protein